MGLVISIRRAVFVRELPFAADQCAVQVVVGIHDGITRAAVSDLEVDDFFAGAIDQLVPIAGAAPESRAHAGAELRFAGIGDEHRITLQYVDEFVLPGMRVAQGRAGAGHQPHKIHAEV